MRCVFCYNVKNTFHVEAVFQTYQVAKYRFSAVPEVGVVFTAPRLTHTPPACLRNVVRMRS